MRIERIDNGFRAIVPCKVNLYLDVCGRRADGYHELDTIMMALSLCDELEIRPRNDDRIELTTVLPSDPAEYLCPNDPAWAIPSDTTNLVVRSLERLRIAINDRDRPCGADVRLIKRIPAVAGLGGGSADAAAALVLGKLLWSDENSLSDLAAIAAQLGSDVNFFLEGKRYQDGLFENASNWVARCTGRGEMVEPIASDDMFHFIVVHPRVGCKTSEVFANYKEELEALGPNGAGLRNSTEEIPELIHAIGAGDATVMGNLLYNRLEPAAAKANEWIERSAKCFDRYDPLGHCMTGSGSSRFCLCRDESEAEKILDAIRRIGELRVYHACSWQTSSIEKQIQGVWNNA